MKQGSKDVSHYYTIKIGDNYIEKISILYGGEDGEGSPEIRTLTLGKYSSEKWKFDESSKATVFDAQERKEFKRALEALDSSGMKYQVLKTTTTTIEEQEKVVFVDGKEQHFSGNSNPEVEKDAVSIELITGLTAESIAKALRSMSSRLREESH